MIEGRVLITGGSGTLGRAIVRMAQECDWRAQFTIYSRSELLQSQMRAVYPRCRYILGDVANYERLESAIAGHDMVIHAAAMKRIPESEEQPDQCYLSNIIGSSNVIRACNAHAVNRCIGISTDKACRAITAYGASKLAMEKMFQAQIGYPTTFTLVRYGNVVASRGSVIPLWQKQAQQGKPLTVTSLNATRFWMSVDDAVELIIFAQDFGQGVILVPKMEALKISEMANIIAPNAELVETGWRSVEKMHEDLVCRDERVIDLGHHFCIHPSYDGITSYNSKSADRISPSRFLDMLEIAKRSEIT
jgi:UDP-N-acetylglucosamine 4,6-dehydratase